MLKAMRYMHFNSTAPLFVASGLVSINDTESE